MKKRIGLLVFVFLLLASASALAHTHDYSKEIDRVPATCTRSGYVKYECVAPSDPVTDPCNQKEKVVILEVIDHNGRCVYEEESTCTHHGYRKWVCRRCNEWWIETLPYASHTYGNWRVTREATCTSVGSRERFCTVCGYQSIKEIKKLPHPYGDWFVAREATDHSKGIEQRNCTTCTTFETREFYPAGTLYQGMEKNDAVRALQQFLVDNGYLNSRVDGSYAKKTAAAVKSYQQAMGFEATGIAYPQTLTALFCTKEDKNGNTTMTHMPHVFGDWTVLREAGNSAPGLRTHTCLYCDYETESVYYPAGTLLPGMEKNDEVKALQRLLIDKKIIKTVADGDYGAKTELGIRTFQQMAGLEVTGIAYPETIKALQNWVK